MGALLRLGQMFCQARGSLENRLLAVGGHLDALIRADAWLIGVDFSLMTTPSRKPDRPLVVSGGPDRSTIDALTVEYAKTLRTPGARAFALRDLAAARPGRVLTLLDHHRAIDAPAILSIRCDEGCRLLTWLSVHRVPAAESRFNERDRRVAELFHAQTAWAIQ